MMDKNPATEPHSLSLSFLFCDVGRGVGILYLLEASLIPCFLIPLPGDNQDSQVTPPHPQLFQRNVCAF